MSDRGPPDDTLTAVTLSIAGRRERIHAPPADPFLREFGNGRRYRAFDRFCAAQIGRSDRIADLGANLGITAIIAGRHAPEGRLLAVEASARNCAALRLNLSAAGRPDAIVVNAAVGAEAGEAWFHAASAYGFVVSDRDRFADHPTEPVPMLPLDDIVRGSGLDRIDLIKLDVEGSEEAALRGAAETLRRDEPLVFLEFNAWCQIAFFDASPRRFAERLFDTFPYLFAWRNGQLDPIRDRGVNALLRLNLLEDRCLTDLVGSRRADRIRPMPPIRRSLSDLLGRP